MVLLFCIVYNEFPVWISFPVHVISFDVIVFLVLALVVLSLC